MQASLTEQNLFRHLVKGVKDYAIFALNQSGHIVSWNPGAERIKGYKATEIIGKHFSIFYTEEAKSQGHPDFELAEAMKNGSYEEEGWRLRKDGSLFRAHVVISTLYDEEGKHIGFAKVTRDLTEQKRYESELERARDEAILANALKSRFVANVTHEIRTPLSGIVGLSQLIAKDTNLDRQTGEISTQIFEASKQLLVILNDLLDFAKLEAGKVNLERVPYEVAKVVDEVVGLCKAQAENKNLSISVKIDPQVFDTFVGDPNKLRQVLNNLIHNAIKFTEIGGIEVFVEKQAESLFFSVADTGIGIAPEIQEKLFKPFVQAHESTTRLFGGTGLGLSIARQLVELMGGTIGLVSLPGQGTTIWFILPIRSSVAEGL